MADLHSSSARNFFEISYAQELKRYVRCGFLGGGPWFISMISVSLLAWFGRKSMPAGELYLLVGSITYAYAFGLIVAGPLQFLLARYASGKADIPMGANLLSAFAAVAGVGGVCSGGFFFFSGSDNIPWVLASTGLSILAACLFLLVTCITAARRYQRVLPLFCLGYALSTVAAYVLAVRVDVTSGIAGFAFGHAVMVALLFWNLSKRFRAQPVVSREFFDLRKRYPGLVLAGVFYNLGIWIDKFLYWWLGPESIQVKKALCVAPGIDLAVLLAMLSIIPGMAVLVQKMDGEIRHAYQGFTRAIENHACLAVIQDREKTVQAAFRSLVKTLFNVQGLATLFFFLVAENLPRLLGEQSLDLSVFRYTLLGAFGLMLFLAHLVVLFYLDMRNVAVVVTGLFFLINLTVSGGCLLMGTGESFFGLGLVLASVLPMFLGVPRIIHRARQLTYATFHPPLDGQLDSAG